ncbi:alpha/beta fold hydrolase [Microbacterium hominis]|uniref:alpha/beta hydrolase family protein n=1 Tax=Microbacterium TaxID=33882 RepID=UPI00168B1AC0|nr:MULTISPECIES: alpha/beta hydrolase [Microbacterium]QOC25555.1 alpha/beta fold hydrolase [Microbacterium hominis]QOC29556.1 alpha/beta fold hydrolase [Microbacterium hominis]QYF98070.1 alpha/beta fold hydrolase [Microbacterium sp. PAMC21962]
MKAPRRAAFGASRIGPAATLRMLALALAAALFAVVAMAAGVALRMARRVVTPSGRVPDTRIVDIDVPAQTITLARTADTVLPGRYGLFTTGSADYLKVGSVLSSDETTVKRKLLTQVSGQSTLAPAAAFSGWYYQRPEELHLPFTTEHVHAAIGPCPAWLFPAEPTRDLDDETWVIQIHGRGTTRAECLRAVPVFHALGITSLVVSYRNDGDAPRSRAGAYALGATEWRDVDAAVGWALRHGARRVLLMGWSMGGAIALQTSLGSAHREQISGVILDSPVVDWRTVLAYQAKALHVPSPVTGLAIGALRSDWTAPATGADGAIPFDRLDIVARAGELRHPVLILHSDDDGFVPSSASHRLTAARPDLVDLQVFRTARHTKLWNYDQQRWTDAIGDWLRERDLLPVPATHPTDEGER